MCKLVCFMVWSLLCLPEFVLPQATYQCGIRQHGVLPLVGKGSEVEEGHWPWHAAVFQRLKSDDPFKYGCGGTLVNERHVLTAAHCVVKRISRNQLPAITYEIELHFGQHQLSNVTDSVVIRDVSKAHVHPEYALNRNDIAVLAMRLPVDYSDTVFPICLDQKVDDLRELEGQRGWITGWGKTENGNLSDVLQTASMSVISYVNCLKDDPLHYGHILNENVFCAGSQNEADPGLASSGSGMYISDGDRWILRGIVSLGKYNELKQEVEPLKYTVFVNVQPYLIWIKEVIAESEPRKDRTQKRISELECERFQSLAVQLHNGDCVNNRYRHDVLIFDATVMECNGVLVEENHVITTCSCIRSRQFAFQYQEATVMIDSYGNVQISEMFCHPKYTGFKKHYDIAIIKLNASVSLGFTLIPTCLANNWTENLYDTLIQTLFVSEWFGNNMTLIVSEDNRLTSEKECSASMRTDELCVRSSDHSLYQNNSELIDKASWGAALQTFSNRSCMPTLVGLMVRNVKKNSLPTPSWVDLYTRVSSYLDWIEQGVWNVQPKEIQLSILGSEPRTTADAEFSDNYNVDILHWSSNSSAFEPRCSGTVISVKHVLTTAQCVTNGTIGKPLAADMFELHFGKYPKGQRTENDYIRYVSEVQVHPEHSVNDIAILVTSWPVRKSQYVAHCSFINSSDFMYSVTTDVSLTGWSIRQPNNPTNESKDNFYYPTEGKSRRVCLQNTTICDYIFILDRQECSKVGLRLSVNQFCASYPNEEVRIIADHGSGMRLFINYTWVLAGVVSSETKGNDDKTYTILTNAQPYISWIDGIMSGGKIKRISERECERFSSYVTKKRGACYHSFGHIVRLYDISKEYVCLGVLVKENRVLTSCQCTRYPNRPSKVQLQDGTLVDISKKICHPDYNSTTFRHDVAVLELATAVDPEAVEIACLANADTEDLLNPVVQVASWQKGNTRPAHYESMYENFATEEECNRVLQPSYNGTIFKPGQTCVINNQFRKDKFSGSFFHSIDNRDCSLTVMGVGSLAVHNPDIVPGQPDTKINIGIVHRVAYYLDWIEQVVWKDEFVNKARNIHANTLSFAVLFLGVHLLAILYLATRMQ